MMTRRIGALLLLSLAACGSKTEGSGASASGSPAQSGAPANGPAAPAGKATGPLASLSGVSKSLNDGMAAFLAGKDPAAAFPGWDASARDAEKLRSELKAAGVATATTAFMELELIFEKKGTDVYYLRTGVYASDSMAVFMQFDGRVPEGGKVEASSQAMDAYSGPGAPFRAAGEAVAKLVQGPDCKTAPIATPQQIDSVAATGPLHDDLAKGADAGRLNVDKVCAAIAAAGADKVRLRIDDQTYLAKNEAGTLLGAIRAQFEASPGKIGYSLGKFRPLK